MKANPEKLELALARSGMSSLSLAARAAVSKSTLHRMMCGHSVRPDSLGRVARVLGVDVETIAVRAVTERSEREKAPVGVTGREEKGSL